MFAMSNNWSFVPPWWWTFCPENIWPTFGWTVYLEETEVLGPLNPLEGSASPGWQQSLRLCLRQPVCTFRRKTDSDLLSAWSMLCRCAHEGILIRLCSTLKILASPFCWGISASHTQSIFCLTGCVAQSHYRTALSWIFMDSGIFFTKLFILKGDKLDYPISSCEKEQSSAGVRSRSSSISHTPLSRSMFFLHKLAQHFGRCFSSQLCLLNEQCNRHSNGLFSNKTSETFSTTCVFATAQFTILHKNN